jgi:diguanylate cyclase (GGDEF)-like protein/PAS domain S-box-containing protein
MGTAAVSTGVGIEIADLVPELICICHRGTVAYINAGGRRMLGAAEDDPLTGLPLAALIHADDRPVIEAGLAGLAEAGAVPLMFARRDGRAVEAEVRVRRLTGAEAATLPGIPPPPAGEEDGDTEDGAVYVLHGRDVTERLRAVKDVLDNEKRYRSLVDVALDFMCLCRADGTIDLLNRSGLRLLGRTDEADGMVGRGVRDFVHPDYHEVIALGLDMLAEEDGLVPLKFITRDGAVLDVEMRVVPLDLAGAYMIEARDIGARLRSAEAIREREARLQGILDTVAEGIITGDTRGIIQSFNKAAERIFRMSAQDAIGQNLAILMPEPHAALHDRYIEDYVEDRSVSVLNQGRELIGRRADGETFPLELNVSELRQGKTRLFTGIIRDITDRRRAEDAERRHKEELEHQVEERTRDLRVLSHQTRRILESAGDGIIGLDLHGVITFANPAALETLGWRGASLEGVPAAAIFRHGEGPRLGEGVAVRDSLQGHTFQARTEVVLLRRDGSAFAAEYAASPIEDEGEQTGAVVVFRDITERKAAEERLTVAATVFETTAEGIMVCNPQGCVTMLNPACGTITGWTAGEALGAAADSILFADNPQGWQRIMADLHARGHAESEDWSRRADGSQFACRLAASVVADDGGGVRAIVVIVSDITQRKKDEERIRFQANYDQLTGLPNRMLFNDRLTQGVAAARRNGCTLGLMFIDLDGFKAVNDSLGHEAGDILLKGAASRLRACVRESDTVARLGGDEFTVIMTTVDGAEAAAMVAQRIIDSLTEPFDLSADGAARREGRVSASIGIALLPRDGDTAEDILRNADAAMYHAKDQGKANYQFYRTALSPVP